MVRSRATVRALLAAALLHGAVRAQVDFDRDVRPLLSDRCFRCHGPDANARKGDLRLDTFAGATADRGGYAAIVPGDPAHSEMIARLRRGDADRMPPPESGLTISAAEIARIEAWIAAGAEYTVHWSFRSLARPALPAGGDDLAPIDRFVRASLALHGFEPAPEADRATLIRRVSFDLTGLPPTLEEIDAFVADREHLAYERLVDRLLASERFGERMASDWLDVARYADTYGYQVDRERRVWPWRDWVVRAFNRDLPYDVFLTWQIAGDLVPDASRESRLATTFCRLHRQTNEGGSVEEEMRLEYVADRTQTVAGAFLGLTLECARCHDHKFDPISQREYYALTSYFDDVDEFGLYSHFTDAVPTPAMDLATPEVEALVAAQRAVIAAAERALEALREARRPAFERWRAGGAALPADAGLQGHYPLDAVDAGKSPNLVPKGAPANVAAACASVDGQVARALELTGDDAVELPGVGAFERCDPFSIALFVRASEASERAVILHRSRAWTDAGSQGYELLLDRGCLQLSLIHFWPGDAASIRADEPLPTSRFVHIALTHDGSARAAGLALYVDGLRAATTVVRDGLTRTITGGGPIVLTIGERFRDRGFARGQVDEVRVYDRCLAAVEILALARGEACAPSFEAYLSAVDAEWRDALRELTRHRKRLAELQDGIEQIMVMQDGGPSRATFVRKRGAYDAPGERVEPGTPACLPPWPGDLPRDRLGLARWMTRPDHPLTARVAANRLWQVAFGRGLVPTPENFGSQGARPTHPELLDWLACELVGSGWSVKRLLKQIVCSATYRQASRHDASSAADPANEWLARGPSFRLSAEMIRDQALCVSGLLVERLGGSPVKPYQPPGLWEEKSGAVYREDRGEGLYRRSLYTFWKGTSPPPSAMIFDAASREVCQPRRSATNTPLQALVLLDDPQYVEAARVFAERILASRPIDCDGLATLFRTLTSRRASDDELAILEGLLGDARRELARDPAQASSSIAVGWTRARADLDPVELAAWATVASTMFSHDAAVMRR